MNADDSNSSDDSSNHRLRLCNTWTGLHTSAEDLRPALLQCCGYGAALIAPTADRDLRVRASEKCAGGESNPYALRRWNLNPLRLPVSPPARVAHRFLSTPAHSAC